jgi:hypothetical protein
MIQIKVVQEIKEGRKSTGNIEDDKIGMSLVIQ